MPTPRNDRQPTPAAAGPSRLTAPVSPARDALLIAAVVAVAVAGLVVPPLLPGVTSAMVGIAALGWAVLPSARSLALSIAVPVVGAGAAVVAVTQGAAAIDSAIISALALTTAVAISGVVLRRRFRLLDRQAQMAQALAGLGQLALGVTDPDELLAASVPLAVDVLHADSGSAARWRADGRLAVVAESGPELPPGATEPSAAAAPASYVREPGSLAMAVLTSGRPLMSSDLRSDPRVSLPGPLLERGLISGVAVPLTGAPGVVGMLAVYSRRVRQFVPAEVSFLQSVAAIAVAARQQVERSEKLSHLALHDPLTGLPNRALLMDRVEHALSRRPDGRAGPSGAALALIDLDQFKSINDGFGHVAGDAVLQEVGRRLASAVRPEDTLARFGGDEFALLCTSVADEQIAVGIARRLLEACSQPFTVGEVEMTVTASAGITLTVGPQPPDAEVLLREADIALYRAKDRGGNRVEVFRGLFAEPADPSEE